MDERYPWIYHVDLGWLYSHGTSQKNIWFYSDSIGWFWTSREIFNDHPTSDKQRFIYRVKLRVGGGWEALGPWLHCPDKVMVRVRSNYTIMGIILSEVEPLVA